LFIGDLAARSGTTRKAIRLYETAGILPPAKRTASGYRTYDAETVGLLEFVRRAQRLGFTLVEIGEIVRIKRAGRAPCPQALGVEGRRRRLPAHRKQQEDRTMKDLKVSLCPACTACPEVEIVGDEVRIGEAGNLAVLKKEEWNVLVDLIQARQLARL